VELWQWVVLGICDEVSMMPASWFYQMHQRGKQMFDNRAGFCGGVDWMFAGDFSQLGSVGTNLYDRYYGTKKDGKQVKPNTKKGCALWNEYVRSVSHLYHSHRHEDADEMFQDTLSAMHSRTVTADMMHDLNDTIGISDDRQSGPGTVYVTPGNRVRQQVLKAIYDVDTRNAPGGADTPWKERGHILIQMSVFPRTRPRERTNTDQPQLRPQVARLIRSADQKELKGLAGEVGIQLAGKSCERSNIGPNDDKECNCCGCYACSATVLQSRGLVKSMWLKALDVLLTPDAVVSWDAQRHTHVVQAVHVKAIMVKLLLGPLAGKVLCPGLPPGVVALTPTTCAVTPTIRGMKYRCGVVQVAIVSNRCLTGHKMQGMTVPSVRLISFMKHPTTNRQWLYVACSRVPNLSGLYSEQPLPTLPRYWNKADLALDHEMARLHLMELETNVRIIQARLEVPPQELRQAIVTQSSVLREVLNRLHYLKTRTWLTGPPIQSSQPDNPNKHRPWKTSSTATGVHATVRAPKQRPDTTKQRNANDRSPRKRQRHNGAISKASATQTLTKSNKEREPAVRPLPKHEMTPLDELQDTQVANFNYGKYCTTLKHLSHVHANIMIYNTLDIHKTTMNINYTIYN
jgi:hypothetical protein